MAVPKKRTSKAKKNQRKFNWKKKALKQSIKSIAIGKLRVLKGLIKKKKKKKNNFI